MIIHSLPACAIRLKNFNLHSHVATEHVMGRVEDCRGPR
jgi:hypothetical protein